MTRAECIVAAVILALCLSVALVVAEPEGLSVDGSGEEVRAVVAMDILRAMRNQKVKDANVFMKIPVAAFETTKEAGAYAWYNPLKTLGTGALIYFGGTSDGQEQVQDWIDKIRDKDDDKPAPLPPGRDYYFEAEAGPGGARGRGGERTDRINTRFITRPDGSTEAITEVIVYPQTVTP